MREKETPNPFTAARHQRQHPFSLDSIRHKAMWMEKRSSSFIFFFLLLLQEQFRNDAGTAAWKWRWPMKPKPNSFRTIWRFAVVRNGIDVPSGRFYPLLASSDDVLEGCRGGFPLFFCFLQWWELFFWSSEIKWKFALYSIWSSFLGQHWLCVCYLLQLCSWSHFFFKFSKLLISFWLTFCLDQTI